jgi:hypothetical protein
LNRGVSVIANVLRRINVSDKEDVVLEFTDEELLQYMKMAHEMDITFNEFVERALKYAIEQHQRENNDDKPNS